jgi:hypothetical protein
MDETRRLRPKDALRRYIGERQPEDTWELFNFVFWMEGQDLWDEDRDEPIGECRYHIVAASDTPCPFDFQETLEAGL